MQSNANNPDEHSHLDLRKLESRQRFLILISLSLTIALIGLGAWVIVSVQGGSGTKASAEIDRIFNEYIESWNAYDVDAIRALMSDDFMYYKTVFDPVYGVSSAVNPEGDKEYMLEGAELYYPSLDTQWERLGNPIMTGDGPWLVSQVIHVMSNDTQYPDGINGISILTIVDEDGILQVARDVFVAFKVE